MFKILKPKNLLMAGFIIASAVIAGVFMKPSKDVKQEKNMMFEPEMVVMYSPTCPHCHDAIEFIEKHIKPKFPKLKISMRNVTTDAGRDAIRYYADKFKLTDIGVPLVVFGDDKYEMGFGGDITGEKYIRIIKDLFAKHETANINIQIKMGDMQDVSKSNNGKTEEIKIEMDKNAMPMIEKKMMDKNIPSVTMKPMAVKMKVSKDAASKMAVKGMKPAMKK